MLSVCTKDVYEEVRNSLRNIAIVDWNERDIDCLEAVTESVLKTENM